jgi:peptidoglycan/xylan/chitin deacetylase (PgdA/CDA1 family)
MKELLVRLGLAALAQPLLGGAGAVLVFHRLREHDPALTFAANHRNSITPALVERLLDTLEEAGIEVVGLDEALARIAARRRGRFVCLTFDDGYRDNHDALLPILEARRVPATIYVAPGLIDGTAPLWWYALDEAIAREPSLLLPLPAETELPADDPAAKERAFAATAQVMISAPAETRDGLMAALAARYGMDAQALAARHMMDWDMLRRLAASPFVEIGAHTLTHPPLATLDGATAAVEMAGSRDRLERETGRPVRHLAYPYGVPGTTGAREAALADQLGFRTAVTTAPGNLFARHAKRRHAWPRHGIGPADGPAALRLKLAGISNPLRAARPDR